MRSMKKPKESTYWAGNVLGGMPRYTEGFLSAVAAVKTVQTGKRLQKDWAYLRKVSIRVTLSRILTSETSPTASTTASVVDVEGKEFVYITVEGGIFTLGVKVKAEADICVPAR